MIKREKYTTEFERDAVNVALSTDNVRQVARDPGINHNMFYRWVQDYQSVGVKAFPGNGSPKDQ